MTKGEARKVRKALHSMGKEKMAAIPRGGDQRIQELMNQYEAHEKKVQEFWDDASYEILGINRTHESDRLHEISERLLNFILPLAQHFGLDNIVDDVEMKLSGLDQYKKRTTEM